MAIKRIISAASTNLTAVKTSAGQLKGWAIVNRSSSARAVHLYNVASGSVTVGTTVPNLTIDLPGSGGNNYEFSQPIPFSTAITLATTAENTDTGTTAVGAGDLTIQIIYW